MTTTLQQIKLNSQPGQQFTTTVDDKRVEFLFRYNSTVELFSVTVSVDNTLVLSGALLVLETDLFASYNLGIGELYAVDVNGTQQPPTLANIVSGVVELYLVFDDGLS